MGYIYTYNWVTLNLQVCASSSYTRERQNASQEAAPSSSSPPARRQSAGREWGLLFVIGRPDSRPEAMAELVAQRVLFGR